MFFSFLFLSLLWSWGDEEGRFDPQSRPVLCYCAVAWALFLDLKAIQNTTAEGPRTVEGYP